jgi:glucose/arabinose dehydrogenase/mono/diheme cytochrome c family protein
MRRLAWLLLIGGIGAHLSSLRASTILLQTTPAGAAPASPWADVVEPDFPFFSSVLDARTLGAGWPDDNLTPRGLILNLGHGYWACFDIDLLRVSAVWEGSGVTPVGMAQGSYHRAGEKAPEGQGRLPQISGRPWIANGLYPGWQPGEAVVLADPRPRGPDPRELGRGPIDREAGRFKAVRMTSAGVVLEYEVGGAPIEETIVARADASSGTIERRFRLNRVTVPLWLLLGRRPAGTGESIQAVVSGSAAAELVPQPDGLLAIRVRPSASPIEVQASLRLSAGALPPASGRASAVRPRTRWPQPVVTTAARSPATGAYVVDRIPIPTANPWRRNVRLADIAFLGSGRGAAVTFDGDVWTLTGLSGDLDRVSWRRFTSGLHEPLGIAARGGELFVFDRNGIWRLHDEDGNGEADRHELFANGFVQTAETREFATSLRVAPDGSFVIAKGGQEGTTIGRDNGSVLRISADGASVTKLGYGLRQPFASVDPRTGLVVASDQQGHYVPATPLHAIGDGRYYGFIPLILPKEQYPAPIADPITWIPHATSASAAGQVWLSGARMGPLTDALVLIGYFRPELFLVRLTERTSRRQAAVVSLTRELEFAPLAGAVNPTDGQLYVTGFQIWGTEAKDVSGLARVRYTGVATTLPREVVATDQGVLVRFDVALDRNAANPGNASAERWNYRRTAEYGSPHFKPDGTRGQEAMPASSLYLSRDARSLFIGLPDMRPVMQMRLGWSLRTAAGEAFEGNVYFTPHTLARFDPAAEGFDMASVDLTPRRPREAAAVPVTAEEGRRIAARIGCTACHSADGTVVGRMGPSWKGLFGAPRTFTDRSTGVADADYLRQSILEPTARIVSGFDQSDAGMPSYGGVLTDAEIEALILYIQSLK